MISTLLPFTSSYRTLLHLPYSLLHQKILLENKQIESQTSLLLATLSQINSQFPYTNQNIFLQKKTSHSSASDNSTQKDSELKNKIFSIKKIFDKATEAKKDKSKMYHRGSKYRGVSKNGGKWQVLIMINRQKTMIKKKLLELMLKLLLSIIKRKREQISSMKEWFKHNKNVF